MTLSNLLTLARSYVNDESARLQELNDCHQSQAFYTLLTLGSSAVATRATLALAISDLLGEVDECGWERPFVGRQDGAPFVTVPESWAAPVSSDDARAMARMLLRAADEADNNTPGGSGEGE